MQKWKYSEWMLELHVKGYAFGVYVGLRFNEKRTPFMNNLNIVQRWQPHHNKTLHTRTHPNTHTHTHRKQSKHWNGNKMNKPTLHIIVFNFHFNNNDEEKLAQRREQSKWTGPHTNTNCAAFTQFTIVCWLNVFSRWRFLLTNYKIRKTKMAVVKNNIYTSKSKCWMKLETMRLLWWSECDQKEVVCTQKQEQQQQRRKRSG